MIRITRDHVKKLIREELQQFMIAEEFEDIKSEITRLFDVAKESTKEQYAMPDYLTRVVESGIVPANEFDDFLTAVNEEIDEATLEFSLSDSHREAALVGYFEAADNFEDRLHAVPNCVVYLKNVAGKPTDELQEILEHELAHIEETLLNDKESETGSGQGAFRDELLSVMISRKDFAVRVQDKFTRDRDGRELYGIIADQYSRKLSPERGLMAVEEMRNRLRDLRKKLLSMGETMSIAIANGDNLMYHELAAKYGHPPAQFLIALDYNKDLSFLEDIIDVIAVADIERPSYT